MGAFQDARAVVYLADYLAVDASGKLNALGLGFQIVAVGPNGTSPAMSVAAVIELPAKYAGDQFSLSLELRDDTTGGVATFATPTGQREALRIQQLALVEKPQVNGLHLPSELPCRSQFLVSFSNGLQLERGHMYRWQLQIEGQHRPGWEVLFYTPAITLPVVGGPSGPTPTGLPSL